MAGVPAPELSIAVANAGGLGACGVVAMQAHEIVSWCEAFRKGSNGAFQLNTWIPDPPPVRDPDRERQVRTFLAQWGPPVPETAGDAPPPDFDAQCAAMLDARPSIVSSIMGVYPEPFVAQLKARGIAWLACATTVREARIAEAAGADAIIAQGAEAGGHRGAFDGGRAERQIVGLISLLPAIVDAVNIPVVATGGIADGRGVAAAIVLGASAVQIGTGFLRCPESGIHAAWADALVHTMPEDTAVSRVFSGRPGRSIATDYVVAATAPTAPEPAAYPVQRALTAPMRAAAQKNGDVHRMQAWAGQSAALAASVPAADLVAKIWSDALGLIA
jgi:nitronate monooxygenase